jgi:hypothetical protein
MNLLNTKSLKTTSLISTGLIVASLGLTGNAAMAANLPVHKAAATTHVVHPRVATHVVARRPGPPAQFGFDVGGFIQAMFGGSLPPQYARIVQNAVRGAASHKYAGSGGSARDTGGYDPTFDSPSPPVVVDNSQSQAAIDASDQAMQQANQSMQDLDASIAAAEQQNDAANAAMVQMDINAGM